MIYLDWVNEVRTRNVRKHSGLERDGDFLENLTNPVDSRAQTHTMHRQIIDATQRLPEAQRVVMLLVAIEGMTYQQAADILEVPIGTVMGRLSRARQAVGAMLGDGAASSTQLKTKKDYIA
jgi:RNA polymerase sigma-70 factor (ECF subfamily)